MNELLHAQRTAQLRRMPQGAKVFLSAGCAGRWYFDWIEEAYGDLDHHIGIEYYSPEPDDLPGNVSWIANTVGDMADVVDSSIDLVFSGQNIEHLWPEDVVGFLVEANRVLVTGGALVVDSPNRLITKALNWAHPEHTIEFTPAEAAELAELAGFAVDSVAGLWLCEDDGLLPHQVSDELELVARTVGGLDSPEESFVWWLEARKVGAPDRAALEERVNQIFAKAWPERLGRLVPLSGDLSADGSEIVSRPGTESAVFFGPYVPLRAGRYSIEFEVTQLDAASGSAGWCDVMSEEVGELAIEHLPYLMVGETTKISLDVELDELVFGLQFRLISNGSSRLQSPMHVGVIQH